MASCKLCQGEFQWFHDVDGRWKLGTEIDYNVFREHDCPGRKKPDVNPNPTPPSHNWCFSCSASYEILNPCEHIKNKIDKPEPILKRDNIKFFTRF